MGCRFVSSFPTRANASGHPFTSDGFRDAVDRAKKIARERDTSADVNLECGALDIFLLSCPASRKGATCDTRYSARPHGGLGGRKKKRRR